MTLVAVLSGKGSPGTTTTAAALAAAAAMRELPALLVELDAAGGSLALDVQRSLDPGLGTLMATARRGLDLSLVDVHAQRLGNGAQVLFAPTSPQLARRAVNALTGGLAEVLTQRPGLVVVDCGRWDGEDRLGPILAAADLVVCVQRPTLSGTEATRTRLPALAETNPKHLVVCVGEEPYTAHDVAAALGVPIERPIVWDQRAAPLVAAGAPLDRWLRRTPLMRSAAGLLDRVDALHELEVLV